MHSYILSSSKYGGVFTGGETDDHSNIPGNTRPPQSTQNGSALSDANPDQDKVHYPQESDRRKLTELFDSFLTKHSDSQCAQSGQKLRSVKQISTRKYADSDSSSSASEAETLVAHIPSAQSSSAGFKDDISLIHSFPSVHSLPADASSTPLNKGQNLNGTAEFPISEKKKVHAPKLSFSDTSRSSFDATEDGSLFNESQVSKNHSNSGKNSQNNILKNLDLPSFIISGHGQMTATETVIAKKAVKETESPPVQLTSSTLLNCDRSESPTECTMDSLPSSHASTPVSARKSHISSTASNMKLQQNSSDSDSISKMSQDAEHSGTESSERDRVDDEFVVEEISKIRFQRVSRKAAQCSVPSSDKKSKFPCRCLTNDKILLVISINHSKLIVNTEVHHM